MRAGEAIAWQDVSTGAVLCRRHRRLVGDDTDGEVAVWDLDPDTDVIVCGECGDLVWRREPSDSDSNN